MKQQNFILMQPPILRSHDHQEELEAIILFDCKNATTLEVLYLLSHRLQVCILLLNFSRSQFV